MAKDSTEKPTRVNSKRKGSKNERAIAKQFAQWTGLEFSRTPSSGGLRWSRQDDTVGDIVCTDKKKQYFRFCVEAKFHEDINFNSLIGTNKSDIIKFWIQSLEEGKRSGKVPLLFMRYNLMKKGVHFLGMPINFMMALQVAGLIKQPLPMGCLLIQTKEQELFLMDSRDFFTIPYSEIKLVAKQYLKG
jgi:hypothetical protein